MRHGQQDRAGVAGTAILAESGVDDVRLPAADRSSADRVKCAQSLTPMEIIKSLSHKKRDESTAKCRGNGRENGLQAMRGLEMTKILLAEDDDSMRLYLTRALEKSGYEVSAVDRGTAAIPLLESEHFDLLLTDIVMPEMDGIELAQQAATISPSTRVMFITGFAAVTLRAGRVAPEAKVLSKPFHLKDLVMEVDRIFERTSASGLP